MRTHLFCFTLLLLACIFAEAAQQVKITIPNVVPTSAKITPNLASFSLEWSAVKSMIADHNVPSRASSIFLRLMGNLKNSSLIAPRWRIGGNSADEAWWNPDNKPPPDQHLKISITPATLQALNNAAEEMGNMDLVLGLNFVDANNPSLATNEAKAVSQYGSWKNVAAVEIGNEPDLFFENGLRSPSFTYAQYKSQFDTYAQALRNVVPNSKGGAPFVQGATFCCKNAFLSQFASYIEEEAPTCVTYSRHAYAETACGGKTPTLRQLLSNPSATGLADQQKQYIDAAQQVQRPYWMGETNSVSCGGYSGVSDVFGAALWAIDYLFNLARVGVAGANFHGTTSSPYNAFVLENSLEVRPLYYGMLFFTESIGYVSPIVKASNPPQAYLLNTIEENQNDLIRIWAVLEKETNSLRIIVIHKDIEATQRADVTVHVQDSRYNSKRGALLSLTAPSPTSKKGINFAGQTFDGSSNGSIQGKFSPSYVNPSKGSYSFSMFPGSAALLIIA